MNVLVHMGNDAANQQMIALIKQLGINHNVRIIAQKGTIGKLVDQGIPSGIIGGKLAKFEAWADVVLASPMSSRGLIKCSKYIFMIAHMNPNFDQVL